MDVVVVVYFTQLLAAYTPGCSLHLRLEPAVYTLKAGMLEAKEKGARGQGHAFLDWVSVRIKVRF